MSVESRPISPTTEQLLYRPAGGQVHFSDVFPEAAELGQPNWWRETDFDAPLTVAAESSGFPQLTQVPIGLRPFFTNYGLVLVDDLVRARNERAFNGQGTHPDVLREQDESSKATIAVANYAPRDDRNTNEGSNGSDFYLAVTDSGLEVYTTPTDFLGDLDSLNRVVSLYRIPTANHPEFDGEHEQFRSARIVRSRRHPEHLVPIFEYGSRGELVAAKLNGQHPTNAITQDTREGRVAFIDKFANVRLALRDTSAIAAQAVGKLAALHVVNNGKEHEIAVHTAADLKSAPLGKLAVYVNCSDFTSPRSQSTAGYVELIARVNGNPSTSGETAAHQLLEQVPDLDIATAEVKVEL